MDGWMDGRTVIPNISEYLGSTHLITGQNCYFAYAL